MQDREQVRRYYSAILPFYDESLVDRGDLPFWESMAAGSKRILELGCGTGRVTAVLVQHGNITAVDLLVEMLRRAMRRAPAANLVAADLRQFAFAAQFDLIVLADDPMAHLVSIDDRTRVLRLIADHLTRNGRVVIEGLYRRGPGQSQCQRGDLIVEESWTATEDPSIWKVDGGGSHGVAIVVVGRNRAFPAQRRTYLGRFRWEFVFCQLSQNHHRCETLRETSSRGGRGEAENYVPY